VSAVIARLPRTMSFTRVTGTINSIASRFAVKLSGLRKSSRSVSPGWMGDMVLFFFVKVYRPSVIVHNFNVDRIRTGPTEADPPLIIDANAVLPSPAPRKTLKTVPRDRAQIGQRGGGMQVVQLALCCWSESLEFPAKLTSENLLGLIVPEGPNHVFRILPSHV
jgi:hypothetical protein